MQLSSLRHYLPYNQQEDAENPKKSKPNINTIKMKRNLFLIAVLVTAVVCLLSCKKQDYTPSDVDEAVVDEIVTEDETTTIAVESGKDDVDALLDDDDDDDDGDDDDIASSKSSTNWDAVLNEYESYVNQYISLMKKAQKGDMSAMTEYAKMLEKAENLSDKLDDAEDEMTSAQLSRYMKITNKLANAALQLF